MGKENGFEFAIESHKLLQCKVVVYHVFMTFTLIQLIPTSILDNTTIRFNFVKQSLLPVIDLNCCSYF